MKSKMQKALKKAKKWDKTRLHMPGAKGKHLGFLKGIFRYDFTEIEGMDNLFEPKDMLAQSQSEMAEDIGAAAVFYTVNGSSSGVLALLSLFCGKKVLMARNFHISTANAIDLFAIKPVFIYPETAEISGVINAKQVKMALDKNDDISAVYLTYPNYYGFCADLSVIVKVAHDRKIPVIVDAAHAACFPYSDFLPLSPATAKADVWATSTHKTLPALNQSGYVAVGKQSLISAESVKEALNCFVTTSPSYPIMASIDFAKTYMAKKGKRKIEQLFYAIVDYSKNIDALSGYSVVKQTAKKEPKDILKWVIDYSGSGHDAKAITKILSKKGIYAEAVDAHYILFLLSPVDSKKALKKVHRVLKKANVSAKAQASKITYRIEQTIPKKPASQETVWVELSASIGKIAAKAVAVYPPGVPAVLKGEVLSESVVKSIGGAREQGLSVVGLKEHLVKVYADK